MLDNDIKHAISIANSIDSNYYIDMDEYSRIYQNISENIKEYMPYLNGNYDSALIPTSSGDHILETVLSGVFDITAFDLNRLSKYFAKLKIDAIKSLSKQEYIYFMYEKMMALDLFNYFKSNLDDETRTFWEEIYNHCSIENIRNYLFRNIGIVTPNFDLIGVEYSKFCIENFTNYLEHYYFLQDKLEKTSIEYIDANLIDLKTILKRKYDLINLTNIYEYINRDIFGNGSRVYSTAIHDLLPFLNDNGKMMATYLYRCEKEDVDKYKGKDPSYAYRYINIGNNKSLKAIHDGFAHLTRSKTIMDKLYAFRNVQAITSLSDLPLEYNFVRNVGIGQGTGNHDMALVYKKNKG